MKTAENSVKGLHSTRTMSSARKRCIPGSHNQHFLELYMLEKEKERLFMERKRLSFRMDVVNNRLLEVETETNRLLKIKVFDAEPQKIKKLKKAKEENKEWKTVSLRY